MAKFSRKKEEILANWSQLIQLYRPKVGPVRLMTSVNCIFLYMTTLLWSHSMLYLFYDSMIFKKWLMVLGAEFSPVVADLSYQYLRYDFSFTILCIHKYSTFICIFLWYMYTELHIMCIDEHPNDKTPYVIECTYTVGTLVGWNDFEVGGPRTLW